MVKQRNPKHPSRLGGVSRPRRAKRKERVRRADKKDTRVDKQRETKKKKHLHNPARDEARLNRNHHLTTGGNVPY